MPTTVNAAFEQFRMSIEPRAYSQADATARRTAIVSVLKNSHLEVLDSFRTGSLHRETGIRDYADLDIMVVLHYGKHCKDKTPGQVLDAVRRPLAGYRPGVRRDGQAITLKYATWPNVDVVPAYKNTNSNGSVNHYGIPDASTGTWIKTRPRLHDTRMRDANASCGPEFKRIVKMIKWWNVQNGASLLRSYHIEVMALKADFGRINGDYPWFVFSLFSKMRELVEAGWLWYEDAFADAYLTAAKRTDVVWRIRRAETTARQAWYLTHGANSNHAGAMLLWKRVFGSRFPSYG